MNVRSAGIVLLFLFAAAAKGQPVRGMWFSKAFNHVLDFRKDTVFHYSVSNRGLNGRIAYLVAGDSLLYTLVDSTAISHRVIHYKFFADSLYLAYQDTTYFAYGRIPSGNYHDFFFKRSVMSLDLPQARNMVDIPGKRAFYFDILIGRKADERMVFFEDSSVKTQREMRRKIRSAEHDKAEHEHFEVRIFMDNKLAIQSLFDIIKPLKNEGFRYAYLICLNGAESLYPVCFQGIRFDFPKNRQDIRRENREREKLKKLGWL
jgi:hypothetical protein